MAKSSLNLKTSTSNWCRPGLAITAHRTSPQTGPAPAPPFTHYSDWKGSFKIFLNLNLINIKIVTTLILILHNHKTEFNYQSGVNSKANFQIIST